MQEKYPCYYPGEFSPPTKMHLNTLYWLLNRPEIEHVHVVIGKDNGGPISQEQKARLWEILLKSSFSPQASIIKSKDKGPISEIYSMLEAKSDRPLFIALDEKSARNKKLQKKFDKFPHYGMELIPSQFHKSSQALMKAVQNDDKASVKAELPDDFSDAQIDEYMSILKNPPVSDEPLEDKSPLLNYKEQYTQKFSDGFWKSVFEPIVNEGNYPGKKVGDHKYKGFTPEEEHEIISRIGKALDNKEIPEKNIDYVSFIGDVYDKLVKANPELQQIKTSVPDYRDWSFPKHDIVFGAFSGIPPQDIKDFVEITKGWGGVALKKMGIDYEPGMNYISIKKDKNK